MSDATTKTEHSSGFVQGLGLWDCTMMVAGTMIGSGIFIVSPLMAKQVGSPGWLLVAWAITGILTIIGALSYGELAAMMPRAGGQYVFLREAYSPIWGFLYGWTFFLVIQTGTIAAVAVGFAKYLGELLPGVSESHYLVTPYRFGQSDYAISLSSAQLVGIAMIVLLTVINTFGLSLGRLIQSIFTSAKIGALAALIVLGLTLGYNAAAANSSFGDLWTIRGNLEAVHPSGLTAAAGLGLFLGLCVAQTQSLFSADAWGNVALAAGEVKDPRRVLPLSLLLGTGLVIAMYLLANVAYLASVPFESIQDAPNGRVASLTMRQVFGENGVKIMAVAILISTFGCNNSLILAGSRAFYAMARDGLFFRGAARLNQFRVPAWALVLQGAWSAFLVLPRVVAEDPGTKEVKYGALYGDLLDYVISAALIFYILTIAGVFVLRYRRPEWERPYRAWGYPVLPLMYIAMASVILVVLFVCLPTKTWPGLVIALTGIPVYFLWRAVGKPIEA